MRVRRHHAWGAILVVLFVLPVARPHGVAGVERPVGAFFAWFGRMPALNPRLWGSPASTDEHACPQARQLAEENAVLREHYAQRLDLEADLAALDARLKEALAEEGLDRMPTARVARVLRNADASTWRRSLLVDRGTEDGVLPGLAVVAGPVFLGRVDVVHARSSLVKLLTDQRSRLEVALRTDDGSRLTGYVRGEGRGAADGTLEVRHVRLPHVQGRVLPGAPVFTSNADPRVPAGLLVGYVVEVADKDLDGMLSLRIRPALDLQRSTKVVVLIPD
jgi:rod shape-determining protein MreC